MLSFSLPISHRPERDGIVPTFEHVPFFLAIEMAALAWRAALKIAGDGALNEMHLGIVHVDCDFMTELFLGDALFEVRLDSVGRSSFTFVIDIFQNDRHAAAVRNTIAKLNPQRTASTPLSAEELTALDMLFGLPAAVGE